jgi:toxin CcdB
MPRFDVYKMPGNAAGYVLDVQASLLDHLNTRVVAPLIPREAAPPPMAELNPVFAINGAPHVMLTQALATVPLKDLKKPHLSLDTHHDEITKALDMLFTGY